MGADRFVAMYGVKTNLGGPEEAEAFETRWRAVARRTKLRTWSGRVTDGEPHYVVVGTLVGDFGVEGRDRQLHLTEAELSALFASTRKQLAEAKVGGEPALHLLFEAQY